MRTLRSLVVCAAVAVAMPAVAVDEPTDSMAGRVTIIKVGKLASPFPPSLWLSFAGDSSPAPHLRHVPPRALLRPL